MTNQPCVPSGNTANNLFVCSASYLGGTSSDVGNTVEIAPDNTIVIGGTLIGNNLGVTPVGTGNGVIIRLSANGQTVISLTRIGNSVEDLDIDPITGNIAVVTNLGLHVYNTNASASLWSIPITGVGTRRVAVGSDGTIAALVNKRVYVYDKNGVSLGASFPISHTFVEDVCVHSNSKSVICTGYTQRNGGGCRQLQVAFIKSYTYTGTLKWTNYDWTHAQAHSARSSCADSRGIRVAIGKDDRLYFAGESAGGNSIFRFNPKNIRTNAPNVRYDAYTDPFNTKSNHITYYARMNPSNGDILAGQFILTRLRSGAGNTIKPRAITADEVGNVYITGGAAASLDKRASPPQLSINGITIGAYSGGDAFLFIGAPDFKSRRIWIAFNGVNNTSLGATFNGVSVKGDSAAVLGTSSGVMITANSIQATPQAGTNMYYSVFPARKT